jgi:hypothetical protein
LKPRLCKTEPPRRAASKLRLGVEVAHRRIVVPSKRIDLLYAHLSSVGAANNFGGIPGDFA